MDGPVAPGKTVRLVTPPPPPPPRPLWWIRWVNHHLSGEFTWWTDFSPVGFCQLGSGPAPLGLLWRRPVLTLCLPVAVAPDFGPLGSCCQGGGQPHTWVLLLGPLSASSLVPLLPPCPLPCALQRPFTEAPAAGTAPLPHPYSAHPRPQGPSPYTNKGPLGHLVIESPFRFCGGTPVNSLYCSVWKFRLTK